MEFAPEEGAEKWCEGAFEEPGFHGVEDQLVAAVGVFLPAGEFVVDGEGDAFFEAVAVVACEADDVAGDLETEGDVEVFGDVVLGPVFLVVVFVFWWHADGLYGCPAEECVVADEGCDFALADGESDGGVDLVGEECDAVFEVVPDDLHHAGRVLDNGDFW